MALAYALPVTEPDVQTDVVSTVAFRETMRELASGVALVTSVFEGARSGCVVSSLASLSLTPPSLLICLNSESWTLRCLRASGFFAVNILARRHEKLARRFSSPGVRGPDRFAEGEWRTLSSGAPTLVDALAVVDCKLERIVEHATHAIVIGAPIAVTTTRASGALVHWRSQFESLA